MKVAIPIFNRATYARCKTVIDTLSKDPFFEVWVVIPESLKLPEYGEVHKYIEETQGRVKYHKLCYSVGGWDSHSAANVASLILATMNIFIELYKPDVAIITADRYEMLPAANAFAINGIPICHIQGGEITGSKDEKYRHAITMLADYHFATTKLSTEYIIQMGQHPNRVFFTGCPAIEYILVNRIHRYKHKVDKRKKGYMILIYHPDTCNIDDAWDEANQVIEAVRDVCGRFKMTCYLYMPNPDPGRQKVYDRFVKALDEYKDIFIEAKNEEPYDFLKKLSLCNVIVGNSSCGLREAGYIGVPSVNVGDRQGPRERPWNVVDSKPEFSELSNKIEKQMLIRHYRKTKMYEGRSRASNHILKFLKETKLTTKSYLMYPFWVEFKDRHFGLRRLYGHQTKKGRNEKHKTGIRERISFQS